MVKLITLIGLILLEAFMAIISGCSKEKLVELQIAAYRLNTALGDVRTQNHIACNLGRAYYSGEGAEQEYGKAAKWFRMAAEMGDIEAHFYLGECYYLGKGVEQDYSEAAKWYRMAAEMGDVEAQSNLGFCYYYGEGVEQDYKEAAKWLRRAAEQGLAMAQYNLSLCYEEGEGVEII